MAAPDGRRILCDCKREDTSDISVMNAAGSVVRRLRDAPANDWFPVWSPDGSKIAFQSERGDNWEVYAINADGSGLSNLTNDAGDDHGVAWAAAH